MSTLINLVTNPSAEINASTGYSVIAGTSGVAAITIPTDGGMFGTDYIRQTWSTASTAAGGGVKYGDVAVTAGLVYSFSGYVRPSITNRLQITVEWRTASATISTILGTETVVIGSSTAGDWTLGARLSLDNLTAPATATVARISFITHSGTNYANWSIGSKLDVDCLMAIQATASVAYGDPDTSGVWTWTGTAQASTSKWWQGKITLTANSVAMPYVEVLVEDLSPNVSYITIHRIAAGRDFSVRGAIVALVSGALSRIDYEVPFNTSCIYRAEMFDSAGNSLGFTIDGSITYTTTDTWIHNPLNPAGGVKVDLLSTSGNTISHPSSGQLVQPIGRSVGVIVSSGRLGYRGFPLQVSTSTLALADSFAALIGDYTTKTVPVLCVRSGTPIRIPKPFFISALDPQEIALNIDVGGSVIDWDITGDEVSPPSPGVLVPLLTRADLNAYYATRAALNSDNATRLAVNRRYDLA
jgi:hypothetical protein